MSRRVKLIRKLKFVLFSIRIHRILPGRPLLFISHLSLLSKWIASQGRPAYSDFPTNKFDYDRRYKLYKHIIDNELNNEAVDYFEFGVANGVSFRWWMENITNGNSKFYGFDTFTGLPEDWGPFKKGDMSGGNEVPQIEGSRHQFFQGLFQKTLNGFLRTYTGGRRKVIFMDADLYTSTLYVLTMMSPWIEKGDIVIFDEFNVPLHEFKAFREWTEACYIKYTVIAEANNYYHVAIRIE